MADLKESNLFVDEKRALVDEDGNRYPMVALTDIEGRQTGTAKQPLPVGAEVLERIAASLERIELQLSFMTDVTI